jgi:hypothetical protein
MSLTKSGGISMAGLTGWSRTTAATSDFVRTTDKAVNHWAHEERPEVYIEDGHVVAFTGVVT